MSVRCWWRLCKIPREEADRSDYIQIISDRSDNALCRAPSLYGTVYVRHPLCTAPTLYGHSHQSNMPADPDASDQARHNATSERSAYSVEDALHGQLSNYNFSHNEKGTLGMDIASFCLHFADNTCVQVETLCKLGFVYDTLAFVPEEGPLSVAKIAAGVEFDVQSFQVGDNAQFMSDLPTLLRITCTTPIVGVRLNLWSCSAGTIATRGFDVEPCLQPTPDPYAPAAHRSGGPRFIEHQFGNVMKFKLLLSSCLSLTLHDGAWKLSLYQYLGCNKLL